MTEIKQEMISPEQEYLQSILKKFNADPEDQTLSNSERILLSKIGDLQVKIIEVTKNIETLNVEIRERQEEGNQLIQQLVHLQGQSQGFVDSLLALR